MLCFHPSTYITFIYELSNLTLHTGPPERLLQVMVHLGTTRMNRKQRIMSFFHDHLPEITFRDDKAILEKQCVPGINSETLILGETLSHASLDLFTIASSS